MIYFIGWLYDGTGSYNISFYVAGAVVAFSGAVLYVIPLIQKLTGRQKPDYFRNTELIMEFPDSNPNEVKEVEMSDMKKL